VDNVSALAELDGSVMVERTKGEKPPYTEAFQFAVPNRGHG